MSRRRGQQEWLRCSKQQWAAGVYPAAEGRLVWSSRKQGPGGHPSGAAAVMVAARLAKQQQQTQMVVQQQGLRRAMMLQLRMWGRPAARSRATAAAGGGDGSS
jgi:hypothetical protein